ncbi:uncharacterized protein LOC141649489 [Silene latifolia]|uniref:uncharacterized protein LOC141649489 n=1 Tax=Silene latifolia TaxID=37657 RepID=UPI003D77ABC4
MANQDWLNQFPDMVAHFYPAGLFDHSPCVVHNSMLQTTRRASFKFFNMWTQAPSFIKIVQEGWQEVFYGQKMFIVVKKLKHLKSKLKELTKECYFDIENNACIAEKELNDIQLQLDTDPRNESFIREEIKLAAELRDLNLARESFLKQKAKTQWLEHGDSNTAYFHGAIKKRCSINKITQTEDQNGTLCKDNQSIQGALPATVGE